MLIRRRRGWELPVSAATDETKFWDRRRLAQAIAAGPILAAGLGPLRAFAATEEADPSVGLYPAKRNERFALDRPLTDEKYSTTYNNFYEFGMEKGVWQDAQALKVRPWTVKIDGMVEKPLTLGIDDLLKKMSLEERLYRHRCVEGWSMAVQASEYGFWANVNPDVPHPRWSQASERVLGTNERRPTLLWNGYGEFVADLYKGLEKERLFA